MYIYRKELKRKIQEQHHADEASSLNCTIELDNDNDKSITTQKDATSSTVDVVTYLQSQAQITNCMFVVC
jgi:hypothetical protein